MINEYDFCRALKYRNSASMSEMINNKQVFSLYEVTRSIQKTIERRYTQSYWIKAEMNKLNFYPHSGHCYPDLVEKKDNKVIAQMRSQLWRHDYQRINSNFLKTLNEPLKDGIKILFLAHITFSPIYGMSLNIIDIDPSFTLGDLEKEKQETIKKLKDEKIFDRNKQLKLPLLPQRIAVISVETSKGYADFLSVIENNQWNYKFFHMLFPSLLQGDKAVKDILNQLRRIKKVIHHFDVVTIVRGGGGDVGLSCYNDYSLAKEIAEYPIPVITGIGHSTNETVSEMTAFYNAITPTKLGEFLIQKFHDFSVPVENARESIVKDVKNRMEEEKFRLLSEIKTFNLSTRNVLEFNKNQIQRETTVLNSNTLNRLNSENHELNNFGYFLQKETEVLLKISSHNLNQFQFILKKGIQYMLEKENTALAGLEKNVKNMHPENVLKRGYSITLLNGKAVKSIKEVKKGDELETKVFDGSIISEVKSKKTEK